MQANRMLRERLVRSAQGRVDTFPGARRRDEFRAWRTAAAVGDVTETDLISRS